MNNSCIKVFDRRKVLLCSKPSSGDRWLGTLFWVRFGVKRKDILLLLLLQFGSPNDSPKGFYWQFYWTCHGPYIGRYLYTISLTLRVFGVSINYRLGFDFGLFPLNRWYSSMIIRCLYVNIWNCFESFDFTEKKGFRMTC